MPMATNVKERPILFSGAMVRALLDGSKTQTRRVVKLPHNNPLGQWEPTIIGGENGGRTSAGETLPLQGGIWHTRTGDNLMCPYGQPGDRLWVRETHRPVASGEVKSGYGEVRYGVAYQADSHVKWNVTTTKIYDLSDQPDSGPMQFRPPPWKPSIHMARRHSRITLEVTDVRVERLQDISKEDAIAEGIERLPLYRLPCTDMLIDAWREYETGGGTNHPIPSFRSLWKSINGAESWEANPWVWVVEFRRIEA